METKILQAIYYYEGIKNNLKPFYQDDKAYNTLNSLLIPGITSELSRIDEGRKLNIEIVKDNAELLSFYHYLIKGFHRIDKQLITYRVERLNDFKLMKELGETISFTSTSKKGFLKDYQDKVDLVLMCFHLDKEDYVIDFTKDLEKYDKKNEEEVLLLPYEKIRIVLRALNNEELKIRDFNNNPPVVACDVYLEGGLFNQNYNNNLFDISDIYQKLINKENLTIDEINKINIYKKYLKDYIMKEIYSVKIQ